MTSRPSSAVASASNRSVGAVVPDGLAGLATSVSAPRAATSCSTGKVNLSSNGTSTTGASCISANVR